MACSRHVVAAASPPAICIGAVLHGFGLADELPRPDAAACVVMLCRWRYYIASVTHGLAVRHYTGVQLPVAYITQLGVPDRC